MRWLALIVIAACGNNGVTTAPDAIPHALPCPPDFVVDQVSHEPIEVNGIWFSIRWGKDSADTICGPTCDYILFVSAEGETGIYLENARIGYWSGDQFTVYEKGTFPTINVMPHKDGILKLSLHAGTEIPNDVYGAGCDLLGPYRTDVPASPDHYMP